MRLWLRLCTDRTSLSISARRMNPPGVYGAGNDAISDRWADDCWCLHTQAKLSKIHCAYVFECRMKASMSASLSAIRTATSRTGDECWLVDNVISVVPFLSLQFFPVFFLWCVWIVPIIIFIIHTHWHSTKTHVEANDLIRYVYVFCESRNYTACTSRKSHYLVAAFFIPSHFISSHLLCAIKILKRVVIIFSSLPLLALLNQKMKRSDAHTNIFVCE